MGKTKRQGEPKLTNSSDSTESCDENQNMLKCTHINKAVDLQRVKKAIQRDYNNECQECKNMNSTDVDMEGDYEYDTSLWLCLKCGNQACGRFKNKHALEHYNTPRSDCHSLCVNTTIWSVWCYECDIEVKVSSRRKLFEAVEFLRKLSDSAKHRNQSSPSIDSKVMEVTHIDNMPESVKVYSLLRARGLANLGNTCFFNSVMQCLGQTPYLLQLLLETSHTGQYFQLPGGQIKPENKDSLILEPLDGTLEEWRTLTQLLAGTLTELQSGKPGTYNPFSLFSRFTLRVPQFEGGQQHDSHELLRHLLEAVREEDLRRYQAVILEKLGLSRRTDPASVEGEKKKIIKFYGQQASELLLPTEQVFRGVLVSTLQCQDCKNISRRDEFFLDLSLPISEKQIPPVLRRKAEELDENKPSKHQLKKEKRAAKKYRKQHKSRKQVGFNDSGVPTVDQGEEVKENQSSESESDADIEDNVEESSSKHKKGTESGYNSDKIDNGSPDFVGAGSSDSGVPSPAIESIAPGSPSSSETNVDMGSPLCGRNSPVEDINEEFERPESRLSFVNSKNIDLKADLEKLSLLNDNDPSLFNDDHEIDGAYGGYDTRQDEKMDEDCDINDTWESTIMPRYQCEEGECSVQSCLNQFTACELLTGNNKVGCDVCTKRHGGPDKKTVYTIATKQLLVCNPPAVLILHLKRFQVQRFRSAKVSKFVSFPNLLDLAAFCSKRCQNLPTSNFSQNKVLYALYGVVQHSGSIHGGHYVAYVKVRTPLENDSYRWHFLPNKAQLPSHCKGAEANVEVPPGKWFYISDSHVSEVAESKVLQAQAYLLFYERIL